MAERMISSEGRVHLQRLRMPEALEDRDYASISNACSALVAKPIYINDASMPHIQDLMIQARKWKREHDIKVLFVDYIQRLKGGTPSMPRQEQVADIAVGLKSIAKELKIPVVALAQVNREVEKRPNKRPGMSDLKDSGAIEQEADGIAFIYRDEVYHEDTKDKGIAEIIWTKNRHGPIGTIRAQWLGRYATFQDLDVYDDEDGDGDGGNVVRFGRL